MKKNLANVKIRITFICCCIILLATQFLACNIKPEYLRIHIRANSDSYEDQQIKYKIRDEVVLFLTPVITNCNSKEQAIYAVNSAKNDVKRLIDGLLSKNGFNYKCNIDVRKENFPTRVYDGITLESGVYEAVIIELGKAEGQNWWCVVYPPLCFSGGDNVNYKSKIFDIINKLK